MILRHRIFAGGQRGGMLIELMMSVALALLIIPFLFQYQHNAVMRAKNIAVANQMADIQSSLEKYIVAHRDEILNTVGKTITRVDVATLGDYGLGETILENADKYQLRILKSNDINGQTTLQGVVVFTDSEITPMRTREIVAMGGGNLGFIEGTNAYGTFGAWRTNTVDLGLSATDGIVGTTTISSDNALYLWRVPSDNAADATMMAALNLGGHNIINTKFLDVSNIVCEETLHVTRGATNSMVFQNRTAIDSDFETKNATCAGILTSDSRNMEVVGTLSLSDLGKFSSFNAFDLWATNMTLSGLSIWDTENPAILEINQTLDMTVGRIDAIYATVGFAGSITPRLVVHDRIEDSINSDFFWDAGGGRAIAHLYDASFRELTQMATAIVAAEAKTTSSTQSSRIFSAVSTNQNATVADFINAINQIQTTVRAKYSRLNLE